LKTDHIDLDKENKNNAEWFNQ